MLNLSKVFRKDNTFKYEHWIAYALIIMAFHVCYGLQVINPTNIDWLLSARHDWGQHYLGWAFYRNEPWTFPLGEIKALCYPVGTNVGYWDSIPLLAIPFKLLSALLPEDFQYLGLWLLSCHLLSGYYTIKILGLYKVNYLYAIIAVMLVAFSPILIYRGLHPALCAHFLILASVYYYLKPVTTDTVYKINNQQVLLVVLSTLINPYMCLMVIGFNFLLPLKHSFFNKKLKVIPALLYPLVSLAAVLLVWFLLGMLVFGDSTNLEVQSSYGLYGLNLNSLFNSSGFSSVLPELPWENPFQYEGYMYLGLGLMLIIITGIFVLFATNQKNLWRGKRYLLPLFLLALALAIFAVTNKITFGKDVLVQLPIPELLVRLGGIFRASGRFFWPAYYLLILFFILLLAKSKIPKGLKTGIFVAAIILQGYDIKPLLTFRNLQHGGYDSPLDEEEWRRVVGPFDKMITYPPFNNHLLTNMDYQDLCFVALKNGKSISTGYSAREDLKGNKLYTDSLSTALGEGIINTDEIYITTPQHIGAFGGLLHSGEASVEYLNGYYLFYTKDKKMKPRVLVNQESIRKIDSLKQAYSGTKFLKTIAKPTIAKNKIRFNVENKSINSAVVNIKGWAFIEGKNNNKGDSIYVTITKGGETFIAPTGQFARPDLTEAFKKEYLEDSGFSAVIFSEILKGGNYTVGLVIKTASDQLTYTDIEHVEKLESPVELKRLPTIKNQVGNLENLSETSRNILLFTGWTAFDDKDTSNSEIKLVFINGKKQYSLNTKKTNRKDVTAYYKNKFNFDDSGFEARLNKKDLPKGNYRVGVMVINNGLESVMMTDKTFSVK